MKLNAIALLALGLLTSGCREPQASRPFDYGSDLGVAVGLTDRKCLDIQRADLVAGERIQFITSAMPQTIGEAEVTQKADQACTVANQGASDLSHYEFRVVSGTIRPAEPAFAIVGAFRTLKTTEAGVSGDLDGDGQSESFRSCTSTEGVHLTVWTGKPLEGRRRWHAYHYLGYDVAPNCSEADTNPGRF